MKTILVPVDFSDTSRNAAFYALEFAKSQNYHRIVFFNACETYIISDGNMAAIDPVYIENTLAASREALDHLKKSMAPFCDPSIQLETYSLHSFLENGINKACSKWEVSLIIMGITGGNTLKEKMIGSNTTAVARHAETPVIIVPQGVGFRDFKKIALACDLDKVINHTPIEPIKQLVYHNSAHLMVLHIEDKSNKVSDGRQFESLLLHTML